jgi:hypothetical protein
MARNHPNAKLASYTYGAKTSTGIIREHLKHHQDSQKSWCIKHNQPNKTKHRQNEVKASEEDSSKAVSPAVKKLEFTDENFKKALINFIVEDDQVSHC